MWQLRSDKLNIDRFILEESLFSIGNGYVGIRGCFEEAPELLQNTIRGSYINGYYDRVPVLYSESAYGFPTVQDKQPRIMDTQTALIYLDGERVVVDPQRIKNYYRVLDMQKGCSERGYVYTTQSGKEAILSFRRMASFSIRNLLSYELTVQYDGEIEIVSVLDADITNHSDKNDPRVASGHERLMELKRLYADGAVAVCEMAAITTRLPLAAAIHYKVDAGSSEFRLKHLVQAHCIETRISSSQKLTVHKCCAFVDGLRSSSTEKDAIELLRSCSQLSFKDLLKQQREYLDKFWSSSDIEITGNQKIQEAVHFQLFQLLQSVGRDDISNISAKGLSGEGYEGHYFWDTEIYVLPLFQMTQPEIAKQLLLYRYHILPFAKQRARELGHQKGAAYPWRTISGIECSSYFPAGTAQYHINADIAYSFIQYHLYHQDKSFMLDIGAEVIFETARIWLELGNWSEGCFLINNVTGPDEYTAIVNNNFYTNAMAKYHLYWANKLYFELKEYNSDAFEALCQRLLLTEAEICQMHKASEAMYLPYSQELGIHAQDDSFLQKAVWDFAGTSDKQYPLLLNFHPLTIYRYQVLKQADTVLAHFLLEDYADPATMRRTFDYYEKITTHDSSLSSCIYGIMASKCGYHDKAYSYFMESIGLDLYDMHGNTKDGLHMANLAGSCLAIINGFAGYRIKEAGLSVAPVLPQGIEGYSFKAGYQGTILQIAVGKDIKITLLQGRPTRIRVYDCEYLLKDSLTIERR